MRIKVDINPINLSEMIFVGRVQPASNAEKYAAYTRPTMIQCLSLCGMPWRMA
jgi:hypothetical protein